MNTPHQYILISSPPEKNAKFHAYRQQYGSFFAFHGSALVGLNYICPNTHFGGIGKLARNHAHRAKKSEYVLQPAFATPNTLLIRQHEADDYGSSLWSWHLSLSAHVNLEGLRNVRQGAFPDANNL